MLSTPIENLLQGLSADLVTDIFIFAMLGVFVYALYCRNKGQNMSFVGYAPTLLTSIGILGTFAGIVIGLLEFDQNKIDESIGLLLGGLKTAFLSSLVGMLLSIVFKAIASTNWMAPSMEDDAQGELTDEVILSLLNRQASGIEELRKSIAGDDEASLIGVLRLARSEAGDAAKQSNSHLKAIDSHLQELFTSVDDQSQKFDVFQEKLWKELSDFAEMLSKSATEQVIEALKQVIQDFNNNLIEQFGDNFKALNEAVLKLVQWQENYKQQLEDMREKYALGVEAIGKTEQSVASISENTETIPQTMEELRRVVEVNQHQLQELERHLKAFADIRDKAVDAVPEIQGQIDEAIKGAKAANDTLAKGMQESTEKMHGVLAEGSEQFRNNVSQTNAALTESAQTTANSSQEIKQQLSSTVTDMNNGVRNMLSELKDGGKAISDSYKQAGKDLQGETSQWSQDFALALEGITRKLESSIEATSQRHAQQADKVFQGLESTIEKSLTDTGESVQKQIAMIDQTAEREIEKVMTSMGSALASIAQQFVKDYKVLVAQMGEVVKHR